RRGASMAPSLRLSAAHDARDTSRASRLSRFLGPEGRVPYLDFTLSLVAAGRGQPLAVRAERHAPDGAGVAAQRLDLLAGLHVPDQDLAPTRRGQVPAVRTEGEAEDVVAVTDEGVDLLACSNVPELHRLVHAAG